MDKIKKQEKYDINLLASLSEAYGVSGFEKEVCSCYLDNISGYVDENYCDVMGNAYGIIAGTKGEGNIMIEAHADEIGFQVLYIGEKGYLYVRRNGGIDEQCVPGTQVMISTRKGEHIPGVIGKKPIHLMTTDDRKRTMEMNQLWVDTGMDVDEVRHRISIGDTVAVKTNWQWLTENRISGKSLDNKLGMYVLTNVMRELARERSALHKTIIGVASVQEEVGSRGVMVAGYRLKPDIAITVDLDFATDVPDCPPSKYGKVKLGSGVVIPLNVDCNLDLCRQMEEIAIAEGIAYQISARPHATGGTNISRLQLVKEGISSISLGIPCRYMHTPVELCDMRDVAAAIKLIVCFCLQNN